MTSNSVPSPPAMSIRSPGWWGALGGPHAITRWSWFVTTAAAVVVTIGYEIPAHDYRALPRILLVLAAQVLLIPALLLGHRILTRLHRPLPALGLAIFVIVGAFRGIVMTVLAPHIEPLARGGLGLQLAVGITYALISLPFIAVVVDAIRCHRALQTLVMTTQRDWQQAIRDTEAEYDTVYAEYRRRVEYEVAARVIDLIDDLAIIAREASKAGAVSAAEELRRLSAEVVRPLSHELMITGTPPRVAPSTFSPSPPILGIREVLQEAPKTPAAGNWATCVAMVLLGLVGLAPLASPALVLANAGWDLVVFGLLPRLIGTSAGAWWGRQPTGRAWFASGALWIAVAITGVLGTAVLESFIAGRATLYWSAGGLYVAISAGSVIASAGFRRTLALDAELVLILEVQEDQATAVLTRIERNRRHLGQVLHGTVTSALSQAAMRLERWSQTMDGAELPRVVDEVRRALDGAIAAIDVGPPTGRSLTEVAFDRVALWADALDCSLQIDDAGLVDTDPIIVEQVGDIIGEAITNAVRHGLAERIWIHIARGVRALEVTVTDDGIGPGDEHRPGGGLGNLARAGYAWRLERREHRTVLQVRIPLAASLVMRTEQRLAEGTSTP